MKTVIRWFVIFGFIFGISGSAIADNTTTSILMVSVQVLDKGSANKGVVRTSPWVVGVSTLVTGQGARAAKDYTIPHAIAIERSGNVTITGKIDSALPTGTTIYIRPEIHGAKSQDSVKLSTTEQDLVTGIIGSVQEGILLTYPFQYSLSASADALEEIPSAKPIVVVFTVSY